MRRIPAMTNIKRFSDRRGRVPPVLHPMENIMPTNVRTFTEAELAKELQAHFRRFVSRARVTQDPVTGEPIVSVEFADDGKRGMQ